MKAGLSNHQSMCVCVGMCVCVPANKFWTAWYVDFLDIWYRGNAIHVDLDAIIFNPYL
jgi:hypothetical protein